MKKLLLLLLFPFMALAVDDYWAPSLGTDYGQVLNWSLVNFPNAATNAFFTNVGATTVTLTADQACSNMAVTKASGTLTLDITDGFTLMVTNTFTLGDVAGQNPTLLLTGTGKLAVTNQLLILNQNAGEINSTLIQSNGTIYCKGMSVPNAGRTATYNFIIGTNICRGNFNVGIGSTGTWNMVGGYFDNTAAGALTVIGNSRVATCTQSGGLMLIGGFDVGRNSGSFGTYFLQGGTNMSTLTGMFRCGANAGSTGNVVITGGYLERTSAASQIGNSGVGSLSVSGGSILCNNFQVGSAAGGIGNAIFNGGGFTNIGAFNAGSNTVTLGTATILINSSIISSTNGIRLGQQCSTTVSNGGNIVTGTILTQSPINIVGQLTLK